MEKILHEIRETETHADKLIAVANEKAALIISKGKTDADAFLAERKQMILAEKAQLLAARKKELEKQYQKQEKKAEKHAESITEKAQLHKKKALAFLFQEFKKQIY